MQLDLILKARACQSGVAKLYVMYRVATPQVPLNGTETWNRFTHLFAAQILKSITTAEPCKQFFVRWRKLGVSGHLTCPPTGEMVMMPDGSIVQSDVIKDSSQI